ncbi:MAG: YqjF family protein [Pirellulales bacterium]
METLAPAIDRIAPCRRPACRVAGYHSWSDLLFTHWRLPAESIAPLLPPELSLDTWEGDAWVGLVPFRMSGVRPWWSPWGVRFLETNVRTYVHFRGRDPGVWFFSLEANHRLAVRIARSRWRLNYHWAQMGLVRERNLLRYKSRRRRSGDFSCLGARLLAAPPRPAQAGSLEHFLIERYFLYAGDGGDKLWRGQVHHRPYLLQPAELLESEESLLAASGIHAVDRPCHVLYSAGVDVEIFPLIPVATAV